MRFGQYAAGPAVVVAANVAIQTSEIANANYPGCLQLSFQLGRSGLPHAEATQPSHHWLKAKHKSAPAVTDLTAIAPQLQTEEAP
jgi:hypothetical protein